MEVKFNQTLVQYLYPILGQVHTGEQTQELRLPEGYPDIGRILGCWGQVLIRGKEWRNGMLGATGGVMTWVLYAPEDGTTPRTVDAWIPIQCRWDLPDNVPDGVIHLRPVLKELDARGISARKLMLRAAVDTFACAMTRQQAEAFTPPQMPEDVPVLMRSCVAELPMEAGEKQVLLEESITLPDVYKIIRYYLRPEVQEQKVLGNRLVFRGQADLEMTYLTEDGRIASWRGDFPFSQFTELDRDYSANATAWVMPLLTAMEMDISDGQIKFHGGLAAQYTIFDRITLEYVADAYSPLRNLEIKREDVYFPMLLDKTRLEIVAKGNMETENKLLTSSVLSEYPTVGMDAETVLQMNGQFHAVTQNPDGEFYGDVLRFACAAPLAAAKENRHIIWLGEPQNPEMTPSADGYEIHCSYPVSVQTYSAQPLSMVTELNLGECNSADPDRPSVILRRVEEDGLWGLAKKCGSTMNAIREANKLSDDPEIGQLLLIPVN